MFFISYLELSICYSNIPWSYRTLRARKCQLIVALTYICPQMEVKHHTVILEVTCGQHIESPVAIYSLDRDYR